MDECKAFSPPHILKKLLASSIFTTSVLGLMSGFPVAHAQTGSISTTEARQPRELPTTTAGWEEFMNATSAPAEKTGLLTTATERANEMIFYALSHLGVRYKYGGDSPDKGFDCSGLVRWVFNRTWGMMLPRRSDEIARSGKEISRDQLKPGDLVFFNTLRRAYSHVGIYLGDGRFLHAPSAGGQVRVENMNVPYWQQRWNGARRLEQSETLNQSSETRP